jgi:hypothetical protein
MYKTRIQVWLCNPIVTLGLVCFLLFLQDAGADDWHTKFEETCSKTQVAASLSVEELEALLDETDKLLSQIKSSDDPSKKVYIFRLEKCISFYKYVLDTKKSP